MKKITSDIRSAFSLMEMMIVLLIISIIAAASAPMVSKKMSRDANNSDNPWMYTDLQGTMAYNIAGNNNQTAIIGATARPNSAAMGNPRMYIDGEGGIAFGNGGNYRGSVRMINGETRPDLYSISIGSTNSTTDANIVIGDFQDGVQPGQSAMGIGWGTNPDGMYSMAIGEFAIARGSASVAIGRSATTSGDCAVAIGGTDQDDEATVAEGTDSIAIGYGTRAAGRNSVAIGNGVVATHENDVVIGTALVYDDNTNTITLGNQDTTVVIPGSLSMGHTLTLGSHVVGHRQVTLYNGDYASFLDWGGGEGVADFGGLASDRRLKNVGEAFTEGLDALRKLELFHFTYKNDEAKTPHVGVMAQDLQKIFPDAVKKGEDGYLRIRMEDMFYAIINAVKELDTRISEAVNQVKTNIDEISKLKATVAEQQATIDELKAQNAEFEKRLAKLEKKASKK